MRFDICNFLHTLIRL